MKIYVVLILLLIIIIFYRKFQIFSRKNLELICTTGLLMCDQMSYDHPIIFLYNIIDVFRI